MSHRAEISPSYQVRIAIMAGMFVFWFLYCMYDGYIAYPRERLIAKEYARFKAQDKTKQWNAYARSRGWPSDSEGDPGKDHSDMNIYTQYIMGYGVLPFAVICSVSLVRSFGRWIAMDDNGLTTSWGKRIDFGAITGLNERRWRSKGIAVVQYEDQGKRRKLVLDSFHYSVDEICAMVKEIHARLSPGQITGSDPSPEPESSENQPPEA